jgi:hypothetical protein
LKSVYFALFHSHLIYGSLTWQFANETLIEKIRVLQRKAIRFMTFTPKEDSTSPLFFILKLLKVDDVLHFCVLKFFYEVKKNEIPDSLKLLFADLSRNCSRNLRNLDNFVLPQVKTLHYGTKSLSFSGVKIYNSFFRSINYNSEFASSLHRLRNVHKKLCLESYIKL